MKRSNKNKEKKTTRSSRDIFLTAIVVFLGLGIIVTGVVFLITRPDTEKGVDLPAEISVNEAFEKYQTGTLFVDVREKSEWKEVHVPNTVHIPLGELNKRAKELPTDRDIVVLCRSGNRSQSGRDILLEKGFTHVTSMSGGIKNWIAAGFPSVSGEK